MSFKVNVAVAYICACDERLVRDGTYTVMMMMNVMIEKIMMMMMIMMTMMIMVIMMIMMNVMIVRA